MTVGISSLIVTYLRTYPTHQVPSEAITDLTVLQLYESDGRLLIYILRELGSTPTHEALILRCQLLWEDWTTAYRTCTSPKRPLFTCLSLNGLQRSSSVAS